MIVKYPSAIQKCVFKKNSNPTYSQCDDLAPNLIIDPSGIFKWNTSYFDNGTYSVLTMDSMFDNTYELEALDISNFDTTIVTNMSYMFNNSRKISSLNLSHFNTANVTNMDRMFYNMFDLENLDLSGWILSDPLPLRSNILFGSPKAVVTCSQNPIGDAFDISCIN